MKTIRFGNAKVIGHDFVITKISAFSADDESLQISCADEFQIIRLDIPKELLDLSVKSQTVWPKYRDRITLYSSKLSDGGFDDDLENVHFYASFLLAAEVNGRKWFMLPENKAFSLPYNTSIV